ncbi:DUF349 domain-containing protein [Nocardioides massiliensis]|uniref:DUF349 domain-containing protein n=1 Tax=Nocardioides massiliensis TaxID=1325935 RepID=UPI00082BA96A|nr:DUF349 domain-containing protein [Nocardioides massiliensis]
MPVAPPTVADAPTWGRVAEDGTVYVRTADGERAVGQYPEGTAEEALTFFVRRFEALAFEVDLLEKRIATGTVATGDAEASLTKLRGEVVGANAVGDLGSLEERLTALESLIEEQRAARKAERAQRVEQARARMAQIADEAEKVAAGNDWRNGANRLRDLLEEWKGLSRQDKTSDDALWRRFSTARTTYTRRRKAHFAEQNQAREGARQIKERLVAEAEALADSTDWGPTAGKYRDLMQKWKAAGPAPKDVDDALWKRFRGAQDTFFGARDAANAALDEEFAANAEVKEALLAEAEALLPIEDIKVAKEKFRGIAERWEAAGKVPRARIKELEARIRKVEQAIRSFEDEQWRRTDPEKSARANEMVTKLETAIADVEADLAKAREAGNAKKVAELEENLASRQAFLEMARRTSQEFSG